MRVIYFLSYLDWRSSVLNFENVTLWFAKNEKGKIITIDEIDENNKNDKYYCPVCGSELIPKAINSKYITQHFAHVDASKCNNETMIHWWFKNKFLEPGDIFTVVSDKERQYVCKEVLVEQTYKIDEKIYKPDVTVITECGNTIYFEMDYSNKKKLEDYIDIWLQLRNIVVEINIKDLINKNEVLTFKALFYDGRCFNTKKNDLYYNTIGKYKEEKLKGSISKELKERIQKLDWFWRDVFRYKKGEVNIEYMTELINSIDGEEQKIVFTILEKPKCNQLYLDYKEYDKKIREYNKNIYQSKFIVKANEIEKRYNNSVKIYYDFGIYRKYISIKTNFRDSDEWNKIGSIENSSYSLLELDKDIEYIEKKINCEIDKIEKIEIRELIIEAINIVNEKIADLWYSVDLYYNTSCKYDYLIIYFLKSMVKKVRITNIKMFKEANIDDIVLFIENTINTYRQGLRNKFSNIEDMIIILDEIVKKYEDIKQDLHCFKTYDSMVDYKFIDESSIEILVNIPIKDKFEYFNIKKGFISKWNNDAEGCIKIDYDDSNLEMFNQIINDEIDKIYNNISFNCIDCKKEYILSINEMRFYFNNKLKLPKRCKSCRQKRKLLKNNN